VEGDYEAVAVIAANQANHPIAVNQRMAGESPNRHFGFVIRNKIFGPNYGPLGRV